MFVNQTAMFILHFKSAVAPIDLTPREITKIKKPVNCTPKVRLLEVQFFEHGTIKRTRS